MSDVVFKDSKHREEVQEEMDAIIRTCGSILYRITRSGGVAYIYHHDTQAIMLLPKDFSTEKNLMIFNELDDLLMEYASIFPLVTTTLTWEEYNRNSASSFLDWVKETHPEIEPFEAEYIGPKMKDTRTKFGTYYENGERIIYN